jgi:hypothetical protein
MDESTASELQSLGTKSRINGTAAFKPQINGNHLSVHQPAPPSKHPKKNGS